MFSCADYFASDACVTTWVCESDPACTNVSTCRGETAGGTTTKKNGDTNVHLSPWILINVLHKTESSVTLSGCSPQASQKAYVWPLHGNLQAAKNQGILQEVIQ